MTLRLAIAYRETGRNREAAALARSLGTQRIRIGGRATSATAYLAGYSKTPSNRGGWRVPGGNPRHNRLASTSTPHLRPLWTRDSVAPPGSPIPEAATAWIKEQRERGRSTAVANAPLVVGPLVIARDFTGIRALQIRTGRERWKNKAGYAPADSVIEDTRNSARWFREAVAGNSLAGTLTSDGVRVFFVDGLKMRKPAAVPRIASFRRFSDNPFGNIVDWNHLNAVALDSRGERNAGARVWRLGGDPAAMKPVPLAGHYFFGPPLPAVGRLYVLSEHKRRLFVHCLQPGDGRVLWSQPLALVGTAVGEDGFRRLRAATPVFADGLIVCPTHCGFLVAVDALTGSLRWGAFCGDSLDDLQRHQTMVRRRFTRGHVGFRLPPVIHRGRVFYLPADGQTVFCFDLRTGRKLWSAPRRNAAYIGCVDDGAVLLVGRREARSLAVADGRQRWATTVESPAAGRGLATGGHYLLPVESGRVVTIDRRTGRLVGFAAAGAGRESKVVRVGNLVPAGETILASSSTGLQAFPSAASALAAIKRNAKPPYTLAETTTAAELSLLLGRTKAADDLLTAALRDKRGPARQAESMKRLLRESLFLQLHDEKNQPAPLLKRLDSLTTGSPDRGRYLIEKAEYELARRNAQALLQTLDDLAALKTDTMFAMPGGNAHRVSVAAWAPTILRRALKDRSLRPQLDRHVRQRRTAALQGKSAGVLERYLTLFDEWPGAGAIRNELARRLIDSRSDQRAELLLLATRKSGSAREAAIATALLFELWAAHGLHDRAAMLLTDLRGRFAEVALQDGRTTGRAFVRTALKSRLTRIAFERRAGPAFPVRRVSVAEDRWRADAAHPEQKYGRFRQLFPTGNDSPYDLLDLGTDDATTLTLMHRETGAVAGKIAIPSRHSYPILSRRSQVGQFLALGSAGRMHGLSLLEAHRGKPFWTTAPFGFQERREMLTVGPARPSFAAFQAGSTLAVVDPGTGRLLWQRDGLPPQSGLQSDAYAGLFGDEHVLVLFSEDRTQCTVFRTQTGETIRRRSFPLRDSVHRELFGRFLFLVSKSDGKSRLRVWDPLDDKELFQREVPGTVHTTALSDSEVAALFPTGELIVLHVPSGKVTQRFHFQKDEVVGANYLKAYREGGRLIVNVQRPVAVRDRFFSFYAGDAFGRIEHVRGELYAWDLKSGRRLWRRLLPQRTILRPRHGALPIMVLVSRIRDRRRGTRVAMLVEVLDARTGRTLGRRADLLPDRFVHLSFDPESHTVCLRGLKHRIVLHMHRRAIGGANDEFADAADGRRD